MNQKDYIDKISKKHYKYLKLSSIIEENLYKFNEELQKLANKLTDEYIKNNKVNHENYDIKDNTEKHPDSKQVSFENVNNYSVKNPINKLNKTDSKKYKLLKKLYFKISIYLHPDKTNDINKINDFYKAKESLESNILYKLIIIAEKYNIRYYFLDEYFQILDSENIILDSMISKINNSIVLKWSNETDLLKKLEIIKKYMLKQ